MKNKKYLIFSYNKVPLVENDIVEGTGLRYWRLAKGFVEISKSSVLLAVLDKNNQSGIKEGIKVVSFSDDVEDIKKLINSEKPDVIIASYWMSGIARKILDSTPNKCIFIADAYSPFYVEFFSYSNSQSADKSILQWYPAQLDECNYILANADHILIANGKQEELYRGVLSGLGFDSYKEKNIFIKVPGAVELSNTTLKPKKIDTSRAEILWFGGMYPWFNFSDLIDIFSDKTVSCIAYLRVVGGWNPLYKKTDKRYNSQYQKAYLLAKSRGLINKSIYFEDWVPYGERLNKFASADWAISINSEGDENAYSWRIRVADLAGNDVPVMTNGGDPLGEWLIKNKLATRLTIGAEMKELLVSYISNKKLSSEYKTKLSKAHEYTHIYSYVENVDGILKHEKKPPRLSRHQGQVIKTYLLSKKIIHKLEDDLKTAEKDNIEIRNKLNEAQNYIDSLPKSIKSAIPYGSKIVIKRIKSKFKK